METKTRLFIYDRKEVGVLILLGIMVAIFAFTLGIHLGKRAVPHATPVITAETHAAPTQTDEVPNRQELTEQAKGAPRTADEALSQEIHEEVSRTGIKLDTARQVELPQATRAVTHGQREVPAANEAKTEGSAPKEAGAESVAASARAAAPGKYTLQIGAFPSLADARERIDSLEAQGLKPVLRAVDLKQKGKWYRVFLGGYATKEEAEEAGTRYQAKHVVDTFLVSPAASEK